MEDIATTHDVWMLPQGRYVIRIGLYREAGDRLDPIKVTTADIQIESKNEARYFFNQFTDLARRVGKLNRAVSRLFARSE